LSGYEKIDRYLIENKLIYKSFIELPRDMMSRKIAHKIMFTTNGKDFIDYTEDINENGAKKSAYIKNNNNIISFLGVANGSFAYLDKMAARGNFTVFDKEALVTYPPLIRRYNFKKRGEQFFNIMTVVSPGLPPVPGVISITAIGKDIIDFEGKKVKCENLVFELQNGDLISVWAAQAFHNILIVKIPKYGFKAVLCTQKELIPVEEYRKKSGLYSEKDLTFQNGDITLQGILSIPNTKNGPYPAVLLVWGEGPLDNSASGLFTDISHSLAENSYCVLRFDKRGIGKSQGFFSTYDQAEEIDDLKKAVEFLKGVPDVDKERIGILGYREGSFYAAYLASADEDIRGCVLLSASASLDPLKNDSKRAEEMVKENISSDPLYIENVIKTLSQSKTMAQEEGDWITIEGSSVFTKKLKMQNAYQIPEALEKLKIPVLIIDGTKDGIYRTEEIREIEDILSKSGNSSVTAQYFANLDDLLGHIVRDGYVREHIEIDPEVTKNIVLWLDENLIKPSTVSSELPEE
jgi:alpha/beta superfamily hydrolase